MRFFSASREADGDDLSRAMELSRQTYLEVLDATKHQDDKVNRFLVAIAFLTTGVITFLLRHEILSLRYQMSGNRYLPLLAICAALYILATAVAVILLLMALSSELKLPGRKSSFVSEAVPLENSLLYFQMIGAKSLDTWLNDWEQQVPQVERQLRLNYLRESHNLSERAKIKYGITDEAAAVYIYGLQWLLVGMLLGIHSVQVWPGNKSNDVIPFFGWPLILFGVALALHPMIQLYNVYRHERSVPTVTHHLAARAARRASHKGVSPIIDARAQFGDGEARMLRSLLWLIALVPLYVGTSSFAAASPSVGDRTTASLLAAATAVLMWPPIIVRVAGEGSRPFAALLVLVAAVFPALVIQVDPWAALLAAVAPGMVLSAFTVWRQVRAGRKAIKKLSGKMVFRKPRLWWYLVSRSPILDLLHPKRAKARLLASLEEQPRPELSGAERIFESWTGDRWSR